MVCKRKTIEMSEQENFVTASLSRFEQEKIAQKEKQVYILNVSRVETKILQGERLLFCNFERERNPYYEWVSCLVEAVTEYENLDAAYLVYPQSIVLCAWMIKKEEPVFALKLKSLGLGAGYKLGDTYSEKDVTILSVTKEQVEEACARRTELLAQN